MALGFTDAVRTALAADLLASIDAGPSAAQLVIYDGSRPASADDVAGAAVILSELPLLDPPFVAGAAGVLTASLPITDADGANADGTASWFRIFDGNGVGIIDGDVDTSGSDLNLSTTTFTTSLAVDITSMVLTIGNP